MEVLKIWSVLRQDDNGNVYVVKTGLSAGDASALVLELESHGHKQLYWATQRGDSGSAPSSHRRSPTA